MSLARHVRPPDRQAVFALPGWHVWCPTAARTPDGRYHLLFSRWPAATGFESWVTHSEVAHAHGPGPAGPWTVSGTVLGRRSGSLWDAHVAHNPTLFAHGGRWWCFYMGTRGPDGPDGPVHVVGDRPDASWWAFRNGQRIGLAVADHPAGPWTRQPAPLIDVDRAGWRHTLVSNPTVAAGPDGLMLVYKTVTRGPSAFGGRVLHGVARADHPTGPWRFDPEPFLDLPGVRFAAEDPFLWHDGARWRLLAKDHGGALTGAGTCIAELVSDDGRVWVPAELPVALRLHWRWRDGGPGQADRQERPSLVRDRDGVPAVLLTAVKHGDRSCLVAHPLAEG